MKMASHNLEPLDQYSPPTEEEIERVNSFGMADWKIELDASVRYETVINEGRFLIEVSSNGRMGDYDFYRVGLSDLLQQLLDDQTAGINHELVMDEEAAALGALLAQMLETEASRIRAVVASRRRVGADAMSPSTAPPIALRTGAP